MEISQAVAEHREALIDLRRDFHAHPELGFAEHRTQQKILDYLKAMEIDCAPMAGTGVVGHIHGEKPGKTILLRSDMDALPIAEETDLPFRSVNDGVMHACGHDGHMAMLLVAARLLQARKERICGTVKLVFQPNEEEAGAQVMIDAGVMENPAAEAAFGLHLWSLLPTGQIDLRPGPVMAASHYFHLAIKGRGGHAGFAHQSIDPIQVAAQVIQATQAIQTREIDALDPAVIMFTAIQAGSSPVTVPEEAHLQGSIRFLYEGGEALRERFERVVKNICQAHRADYELTFEVGNDLLSNDGAMVDLARSAASMIVGDSGRVSNEVRTMAGEDFAAFARRVPAAYAFIGARNEAVGAAWPHHHPRFTIDEAALPIGVELYVRTALKYLRQPL